VLSAALRQYSPPEHLYPDEGTAILLDGIRYLGQNLVPTRRVRTQTFAERFRSSTPHATLGGKGASLYRLVHLGHRVAPGVIVTAEAFSEHSML
jgi:hypothetical protein